MILSHSRPKNIAWSVTGTGAEILTDSARLTNGRPISATKVRWLSGAQTTSSALRLQGVWPTAVVGRLCGLVGLTLPAGTRIVCSTRRATDDSFGYMTREVRIVQRLDGVRAAWFDFDAGDPIVAVEFAIYNDVNGTATIAADSEFSIGEGWAGQGSDWCIRTQYESGRNDLSRMLKSVGGQPYPVRRRAESTSQIEVSPVLYDSAFGTAGSIEDIRERMLAYEPVVVVPISAEPFKRAAASQQIINERAEFGYCSNAGPITGDAPRFVFSAQFTAPPALRP